MLVLVSRRPPAALIGLWLAAWPAALLGQGEIPSPEAEELANHAYTNDVGFGGYSVGEERVSTVRLPFSHTVRSLEDHDWGLKLRLPVSLGVYDFTFPDFIGDLGTDRLRTLAVVPGVEFQIPLSPSWTLKPYQELGAGKDFEGGDLFLLSTTGLKALYIRPWEALTFTFGSGVRYSLSHSASGLSDEDFGALEVGLDTRFPLGFEIKGHEVDASVYGIARHFFRTLVFQQPGGAIDIERQLELGFTVGTTPRPLLWKIRLPRIGVGYRFSENLRGIRINFGFPF